jgi:hypothetical protein
MAEASSSEGEGSEEEEEDEPAYPSVAIVAESSSSEEESNEEEEEEHYKSSRRARRPDSPRPGPGFPISQHFMTARGHTNKRKKLRYVQDYLLRVPKHQRRRIQKEIDKGYKPGETDCLHNLGSSTLIL